MIDSKTKPKLMLIGYAYMIAFNREKAKALSEYFNVHVCTMRSDGIEVFGGGVRGEVDKEHQGYYTLSRLKRWPVSQTHTKVFLRGIRDELKRFEPDYVLLEDEPWSVMRWQVRYDCWRVIPDATFVEFTWENVRREGWKGFIGNFVYAAAARTSGKVICGNMAAKKIFLDSGLDADKVHVDGQVGISEEACPVATDTERAEWRQSLGWGASDVVVGFCGRIVSGKGVFELLEAVEQLRVTYPNLRLAILGAGDESKKIREADPDEHWLKVFKPVAHTEVPLFLNKLDVFALPSKPVKNKDQMWEEQFGHVLIEAMACGVCTIGSNSGAIPEVLGDEDVIFPHSDSQGIGDILETYLSGSRSFKSKGVTQRALCLSYWTHEHLARRYVEFFTKK